MRYRCLVIGGHSGSGKDTARNLLIEQRLVRRGVTITTRAPRPGEVDGKDYDLFSPERFEGYRQSGKLAEETVYIGNPVAYGISWQRINEARLSKYPTCWVLDSIGLHRMRELFPSETVGVFLCARAETLAMRMRTRGESDATIERRLAKYAEEAALGSRAFDHMIDTSRLTPAEVAHQIRGLTGV